MFQPRFSSAMSCSNQPAQRFRPLLSQTMRDPAYSPQGANYHYPSSRSPPTRKNQIAPLGSDQVLSQQEMPVNSIPNRQQRVQKGMPHKSQRAPSMSVSQPAQVFPQPAVSNRQRNFSNNSASTAAGQRRTCEVRQQELQGRTNANTLKSTLTNELSKVVQTEIYSAAQGLLDCLINQDNTSHANAQKVFETQSFQGMMERMKDHFDAKADANFESAKSLLSYVNTLHLEVKNLNEAPLQSTKAIPQKAKRGQRQKKESQAKDISEQLLNSKLRATVEENFFCNLIFQSAKRALGVDFLQEEEGILKNQLSQVSLKQEKDEILKELDSLIKGKKEFATAPQAMCTNWISKREERLIYQANQTAIPRGNQNRFVSNRDSNRSLSCSFEQGIDSNPLTKFLLPEALAPTKELQRPKKNQNQRPQLFASQRCNTGRRNLSGFLGGPFSRRQ